MRLAFVDTLGGVEWAVNAGFDAIYSDNPLLADDVASGGRVANADALVSQADANALGDLAIRLAEAIDTALREAGGGVLPTPWLRLAGASSRVVSALLYRGLAAARARSAVRPTAVGIGTVDVPFLAPDGYTVSRFCNPVVRLAEVGFFGDVPVEIHREPLGHTVSPEADFPKNPFRRFAHLPGDLIVDLVRRRLAPRRGGHRGRVHVLAENEALRETLPHLARAGVEIVTLGKLDTQGEAPEPAQRDVPGAVSGIIDAGLDTVDALDRQEREAVGRVVRDWLANALARAHADWPAIVERVGNAITAPGATVLTNGLFGPRGTMAYGALHDRGITVVDFEHGVTMGISAHAERKLAFTEVAFCDVLLCCSETAAASFSRAKGAPARRIEAIGLPDQTRVLYRPRLQRLLARRRLGAGSREALVLHVSTRPHYGNMRPGYGTPTETTVARSERCLLEEVYPRVPHRVVYKPYPTQRFPHEPPLESRVRLPPNVSISPSEDLRYLRAAADVIVTTTPTSTLGWVVGAGVPVIWLASRRVFPLRDSGLDEAFADAFLQIDIDEEGWPERLVALLSRPLAELRDEWDERAPARDRLLERAVVGPPGSTGRRAAGIVLSLLDGGAPA